jgi:hypothetical protein
LVQAKGQLTSTKQRSRKRRFPVLTSFIEERQKNEQTTKICCANKEQFETVAFVEIKERSGFGVCSNFGVIRI